MIDRGEPPMYSSFKCPKETLEKIEYLKDNLKIKRFITNWYCAKTTVDGWVKYVLESPDKTVTKELCRNVDMLYEQNQNPIEKNLKEWSLDF